MTGFSRDKCSNTCPTECIDNLCSQHRGTCSAGCKADYTGEFCNTKIITAVLDFMAINARKHAQNIVLVKFASKPVGNVQVAALMSIPVTFVM